MNDWMVFGVATVVSAVLLLVARFLARLEIRSLNRSEIDPEPYTKSGALRLEARRAARDAFFTEFIRPSEPHWDEWIEICESPYGDYTRLTFEFPQLLHQGIRLMREQDEGLVNRLLQMRELEIGDAEFDDTFLILAHDEERFSSIFARDLRKRFVTLAEKSDDVRVSDAGGLVLVRRILTPAELEVLAEECFETLQGYYTRSRELLDEARLADEEADHQRLHEGSFGLPRMP